MATEDRFLNRLRGALKGAPQRLEAIPDALRDPPTATQQQVLHTIRDRTAGEYRQLIDQLVEAAALINLQVTITSDISAVAEAVVQMIDSATPEWSATASVVAWRHPLIEALNLAPRLARAKVPIHFTPLEDPPHTRLSPSAQNAFRDAAGEALLGITSADFCLADTATLVLKTRPGQARVASLLPSIHVAIIERSQLLANLMELYTLMRFDAQQQREGLTHCLTFISGPSKTADIEATLVHGAHGPAAMHLFVVDR
jgi:L-lactate dehydrogenase complex protein LldG